MSLKGFDWEVRSYDVSCFGGQSLQYKDELEGIETEASFRNFLEESHLIDCVCVCVCVFWPRLALGQLEQWK